MGGPWYGCLEDGELMGDPSSHSCKPLSNKKKTRCDDKIYNKGKREQLRL